jgi:D-alanyl-D-alanine-carboxypeptidase/D-alanyl-D-alanine-endopeptidase
MFVLLLAIVTLFGILLSSTMTTHYILAVSSSFISSNSLLPKGIQGDVHSGAFKISDCLKEIIRSRINIGSNAAIVLGLVDPSGTQFYGYGKMSAAKQTTVDKNTIFGIASITKTFTTLLLADMADHEIVNLNDPTEKYLPDSVKVPTYNGQKITLQDLATHTSGLPDYPPNMPLYGPGFQKYTLQQMYRALSTITLTRSPGSKYNYSDFGMGLLGNILSSKSGMPYGQLVTQRIANILALNSTRVTLSKNLESRLAIGHVNGKEVNPTVENPPALAPAGSLRSSASDMAKYLSANMGLVKSVLYNSMKESHLKRLDTNQTGVPNYKVYVGLGWFVTTANNNNNNNNDTIIWYNGIFNGYNSFIGFNPIKQRGVIILCSGIQPDLTLISQIGFGRFDNLSNLIWNLLNP